MKRNRPTKELALAAILDCMNAAEADGYQEFEDCEAKWAQLLSDFHVGADGCLRLQFMDTVFRIDIVRERVNA